MFSSYYPLLENPIKMRHFLKLIFLLVTIYLLVPYSIGLFGKIQKPEFKNLPITDYLWIGIVLVIMILLNIKWFYLDRKKRNT